MKKLFKYFKNYRKECVLGPLFKMLEACFELIVPLVMAKIIDIGIADLDSGYVIKMCLVLVLLGLVGLVCSITAQYFAAKASVGFAAKLRHEMFSHISSLSYTEIDNIGTNTMITRMTSDLNQLQNGVNLTLRLFLRSPFVVFGAMIMAFTIDVPSALIFAVAIPVLAVVVFGIMLACIPLYKKVQSKLDRVLGRTRQNLTGVRVIRAFNKEEEETESFNEENEELTSVSKFVGKISALMNPVTYVIINVAIAALIWTGAIRVDGGVLTKGAVVALYNYMSQILIELIKLANLIITMTKAAACANRISDVLEIENSMKQEEKPQPFRDMSAGVCFNHVYLKYSGAGEEALTDIDFCVKSGQTAGIIGGTGSGKSSVVNMVARFYDATSGSVCVFGTDVKKLSLTELRRKIGIVPQKAVLFSGTIRENLKWGNENATDEEIYDALKIAQAAEIVENKEEGLDYIIEQGGKNLSGGQRQRLTIARALVKRPDILILDDSASALDFKTDAMLRTAIKNIKYKPTVFIVSQRTSSIMNADIIIVLDDGKILDKGTHDELLSRCEIYKEIYASQFSKEAAK